MPEPKFIVGQRVKRIENREIVGATVLQVICHNSRVVDEYSYEIQYDEGPIEGSSGTGWWPESCLEAE